jgi:hypothetical protein
MSVEALKWAFRAGGHAARDRASSSWRSPTARTRRAATCYPSIAWIKRKTGISERTVREHLGLLQERGFLLKTGRVREGGAQTSNEYRLPLMEAGPPVRCPPCGFRTPPCEYRSPPPEPTAGGPCEIRTPRDKRRDKRKERALGPENPQPDRKRERGSQGTNNPSPSPLPGLRARPRPGRQQRRRRPRALPEGRPADHEGEAGERLPRAAASRKFRGETEKKWGSCPSRRRSTTCAFAPGEPERSGRASTATARARCWAR